MSDPKTVVINLRASRAEKAALVGMARIQGRPVAELIREAIGEYVLREVVG